MEPHNKYVELFQRRTTLSETGNVLWEIFPILTVGVFLIGVIGVIIMSAKKINQKIKKVKKIEMPKDWVSTLAQVKGEAEEKKLALEKYGKKPTDWKWLLKDWKVWLILIFIIIAIICGVLFSGSDKVVNTQTQPEMQHTNTQTTSQSPPDNATQTNIEAIFGNSINFITTTIIISFVVMIGMMIFRVIGRSLR